MTTEPRPPAWKQWTPADMWDAMYYVAGMLSVPFEIITEDMVWRYRMGMEHNRATMTEDDQRKVNEYYRKKNLDYYDNEPF